MINQNTQNTLENFRIRLLSIVLMVTGIFSLFVVILSLIHLLDLGLIYEIILSLYGTTNLIVYSLLKHHKKYYFTSVNVSMIGSIFTFSILTATVLNDEFRLIWFFFTSFASFMFGGKKYGIYTTLVIIASVSLIWYFGETNLSKNAIFTFMSSIIIFNVFLYFFLEKIEKDEKILYSIISNEISKREAQEDILLRQYRMVNMGEMIDAIAHQWRQPLSESNIQLYMIYQSITGNEKADEYRKEKIEELIKLNSYMSQTVDDFRYLINGDKRLHLFCIKKSIEDVLKLMQNRFSEIEINLKLESISILGLENELIQALIIIISNAIEVLEKKEVKNKEINISLYKKENSIFITIEDNARGIHKRHLKKIFDAYFTTKKQEGGTGLGLYIAKIIIEQNMFGKIKVLNSKKGAKFIITLKGENDESKSKTI
jgi:signal transduction histidine kinase